MLFAEKMNPSYIASIRDTELQLLKLKFLVE
jgi:hypothetical protein